MLPNQLNQLISQFMNLPGIGPRQATRFAFYLLRNKSDLGYLSNTLKSVNDNVSLCANCFLPASAEPESATAGRPSEGKLCSICTSVRRDKNIICLVEKETDALNLEKTGHFNGHYYVLGGFINPLDEEDLPHQRLKTLIKRLGGAEPAGELILALAPRREGDFTSLYIEEQLKPLKERGVAVKTTRLGRGLSSGAELEYADEDTLKNALEGRR